MLPPTLVADAMGDTGLWWAIAGGWAIDLWLGEQTRDHHDVEVVVRRSDHRAVHDALAAQWQLYCLDPPGEGWRSWDGHAVEPPAFQLQARPRGGRCGFEFDLFTETIEPAHDSQTWRFRRDHRITRPLDEFVTATSAGVPIVRPEVQLLYMAGSKDPKNQADFEVAAPRLDPSAASWLATSLAMVAPGHPWLARL